MREAQKFAGSQIEEIIDTLVDKIAARHSKTQELAIAGVANGGIALGRILAEKLSKKLGREVNFGIVNITFQRDDIGQKPIPLDAENTELLFDMDAATVILVDDVFFSRRTARAGMNELFDQGRPERVELAVLCDRGHRKLPIVPDYAGIALKTDICDQVTACIHPDDPSQHLLRILKP